MPYPATPISFSRHTRQPIVEGIHKPLVGGNPHPRWGVIHTLGGGYSTPSVGGNPHPWWGAIHTLGGGQSKHSYKKRKKLTFSRHTRQPSSLLNDIYLTWFNFRCNRMNMLGSTWQLCLLYLEWTSETALNFRKSALSSTISSVRRISALIMTDLFVLNMIIYIWLH